MIKNKNQSCILLVILTLTTICYLSFQYYTNNKKKENHKRLLVNELQSGLRFIEGTLHNKIDFAKKEIDSTFNPYLERNTSLNEAELLFLRSRIIFPFTSMLIFLPSEHLMNSRWNSIKQSGILSQFSMRELNELNLAYSRRGELIEEEKQIQKIDVILPSFNAVFNKEISKSELRRIHSKFRLMLLMYSSKAYKVSDTYYNAIQILEPENKFLKQIDSLRLIKTTHNQIDDSAIVK